MYVCIFNGLHWLCCTYGTPTVQVADFSSQCNDSIILLQERMAGDVKLYNEIIQHETLRVAVCDMLDGGCSCPDTLRFFGLVFFARLLSSEYQKDFLLYNSSFVIYAAFQALRWVLMCHTYWLCEDNCLAFNRLTCCWIFMLLEFCNAMFICWGFFSERLWRPRFWSIMTTTNLCAPQRDTYRVKQCRSVQLSCT